MNIKNDAPSSVHLFERISHQICMSQQNFVCRFFSHCVSTVTTTPGAGYPSGNQNGNQQNGLPPGEGCYECNIEEEDIPLQYPRPLRNKRDVMLVRYERTHGDVTAWKLFPHYRPLVTGIHVYKKASIAEHWWLLCCQIEQAVEQTFELSVMPERSWDAILRHIFGSTLSQVVTNCIYLN